MVQNRIIYAVRYLLQSDHLRNEKTQGVFLVSITVNWVE